MIGLTPTQAGSQRRASCCQDGSMERTGRRPFAKLRPIAVLAAALTFALEAAAAPPTVSHLLPRGGQRGTTVRVACVGALDPWPVSVWAPGVEVVPAAEKGQFDITIPPDLAADRVWVRFYNVEGAAELMPFLIGGLTEVAEVEPNQALSQAQVLDERSVTINGALEGADVDGFAVQLAAGETLVADLDAFNDFGAPMDAILQVVTADGNVVAENHDDVDLDPRLAYTATQAGTYIARVFAFPASPDTSISYRGGPDYVYRLTLTTGPYITHSAPMTALLSDPGPVEVFGWNIPPGTRLAVLPLLGGGADHAVELESLGDLRNASDARVGLVFAPGFAGAAPVRLASYPAVPTVPAPDADEPTLLAPPSSVVGRLLRPRQQDTFRVPLRAGQQVVFAVEARSIESQVQPVLRLFDPTGAVVASVEDPVPTRATILAHGASQDGDYRLTVHDRFRQSGESCFYRLTARLEEADFELTAATDALVVTPDQPAELVVNVVRRAAGPGVGPIDVQVLDLPPGVVAPAVVSEPTGDTAAQVKLTFATTGPAFSGPIRIRGVASIPAEMQRFARTPTKFGACFETFWLTAVAQP
jgi:hypothetical protein